MVRWHNNQWLYKHVNLNMQQDLVPGANQWSPGNDSSKRLLDASVACINPRMVRMHAEQSHHSSGHLRFRGRRRKHYGPKDFRGQIRIEHQSPTFRRQRINAVSASIGNAIRWRAPGRVGTLLPRPIVGYDWRRCVSSQTSRLPRFARHRPMGCYVTATVPCEHAPLTAAKNSQCMSSTRSASKRKQSLLIPITPRNETQTKL